MKVKICGLKSKEDVITACYEGADAVGFIVGTTHETTDEIDIECAIELSKYVPTFITPVLVTHFTNPASVAALCIATRINTVQLQGDISPVEIIQLRNKLSGITIVKAIHVTELSAIKLAKKYERVVDMILLDSRTPDRLGGTGMPHDWSISAQIVREVDLPVMLAGGLDPQNVADAIRIVNPYGVDVNTGVKGENGSKSSQKVRAFIQNVKSFNRRGYASSFSIASN